MIKRDPLGFALAAAVAAAAVFAAAIGIVWMAYVMYAIGLAKSIIGEASGEAPAIEKFHANIFTGDCVFEKLKVINSQDFDPRKYLRDGHQNSLIQNDEMFTADYLRLKISPFSLIIGEPEISEAEIELSSINAIRVTPRMFNLPVFMRKISERVSAKKDGLKLFKIKLKPKEGALYSAIYLDFSSSKDIINFGQSDSFEFERSGKTINETLSELSKEIKKKTSMPFLSKAIDSYLD